MESNAIVGITIAAGGALPALAIGLITSKAMEAIGRNPESASKIQTNMILGLAFAEAIAIYSLVIALILKFVWKEGQYANQSGSTHISGSQFWSSLVYHDQISL